MISIGARAFIRTRRRRVHCAGHSVVRKIEARQVRAPRPKGTQLGGTAGDPCLTPRAARVSTSGLEHGHLGRATEAPEDQGRGVHAILASEYCACH